MAVNILHIYILNNYSFDLSPSNPKYVELGTKELEIVDDKNQPIHKFRHGERKFDINLNQAKYESFIYAITHADLITTTTDYLADTFRKAGAKKVAVYPNTIDFELYRPIRRLAPKDEIRMGWFGGDSHHKDLEVFANLFPFLLKKYPNIKIVILGPMVPFWMPIFKDIDPKRLEWHDWSDLALYPLVLASMDWDIGLCPLEYNEFNKCKSSLKQFEFGALKVPVIAQNMLPYSKTISHGVNGFLAGKLDDWINYSSLLIENEELRKKIGEEGYQNIYTNWNMEKWCKELGGIYEKVLI